MRSACVFLALTWVATLVAAKEYEFSYNYDEVFANLADGKSAVAPHYGEYEYPDVQSYPQVQPVNRKIVRTGSDTDIFCPRSPNSLPDYYCEGLADGNYWDPWNPFCGYIKCENNKTFKECCPRGFGNGHQKLLYGPREALCRRPMELKEVCPTYDNFYCKPVDDVFAAAAAAAAAAL